MAKVIPAACVEYSRMLYEAVGKRFDCIYSEEEIHRNAKYFDELIRIEGKKMPGFEPEVDIPIMINWLGSDSEQARFWAVNIRCAATFRKRYMHIEGVRKMELEKIAHQKRVQLDRKKEFNSSKFMTKRGE